MIEKFALTSPTPTPHETSAAKGDGSSLGGPARFERKQRQPLRMSGELISTGLLSEGGSSTPLVLRPVVSGLNPFDWGRSNVERVNNLLRDHGALLFRGFDLHDAADFRSFTDCFTSEPLPSLERAAPRIEVGNRVFSSTEYPPEYPIPMHHENAYAYRWPLKLSFFCMIPSSDRGATPICDDRDFFAAIDPSIIDTFRRKQVMYVRNYGAGIDMSWQEAFDTDNREDVERYCAAGNTTCEWLAYDRLRTTRVAPAITQHPVTGQDLWFNHAHLFHYSNLLPDLREALLNEFGQEGLPRNAYYGDGSPIEEATLDTVRDVYEQVATRFAWQHGDVLMLDNMRMAHGRESFTGERKILVSMAESSQA